MRKMRRLIESLESQSSSVWADYELDHSYEDSQRAEKERFVDLAARQRRLERWPGTWAPTPGCSLRSSPDISQRWSPSTVTPAPSTPCIAGCGMPGPGALSRWSWIWPIHRPTGGGAAPSGVRCSIEPIRFLPTWLAVMHHVCLAGEVPVEGFLDLVAETSPHAVVEFVGTRRPDEPPVDGHSQGAPERLHPGVVHGGNWPDGSRLRPHTEVSPTRDLFHLRRL